MELGLKDKIALVGGGTRGIGLACAENLLREGCRVALFSRDKVQVDKTVSQLGAQFSPANVMGAACDYNDFSSLTSFVQKINQDWGAVNIFVASSGGPKPSQASDLTRNLIQDALDGNLLGICELTKHLLPGMQAQHYGRFVYVTTSGAVQPIPGLATSNMARTALTAYAKTLAAEVAKFGITVNCIMPGKIATTRLQEITAANAARDGMSLMQQQEADFKTIPAGRYGEPGELADLVAFLTSTRAAYITGANIAVDGGLIRGLR
jgi:3-oxoacyl-[acyl-carrier protein] reductase